MDDWEFSSSFALASGSIETEKKSNAPFATNRDLNRMRTSYCG